MEPFERTRRGLAKLLSRSIPFEKRSYLMSEGLDFDRRLLDFDVRGTVYMDGLWMSEKYFEDIGVELRSDLKFAVALDDVSIALAQKIGDCCSVAVHVRWFDVPGEGGSHNLTATYFRNAIAHVQERVLNPHFFVFSDRPELVKDLLSLSPSQLTLVSGSNSKDREIADFWLMHQCQYHIIANSTYSWWAAWLCNDARKTVLSPKLKVEGKTAWGFTGLIPEGWIEI